MDPTGKRVLILATYGPESPARCTAPFLVASEAALKGAQVSICFIVRSPLLLQQGAAETLFGKAGGRPVSEFIRAALSAGVEFYVCGAALQACDMTPDDLIEEAENLVGPSFVVTRGLESDLVLSL